MRKRKASCDVYEDSYDQWSREEERREAALEKRPVCCYCGEHIQSETCYLINDELVCPDCLEEHFCKRTEDYVC